MVAKLRTARAVKHCDRFIITGKSVLYFKSSGKVKKVKKVANWRKALNFIFIDLAENQSYCLYNHRGMK